MPADEMEIGVEDVAEVKADDEGVKGPGPQWEDEKRAERGAEVTDEQMGTVVELDDNGEPPKGPDPEEWADDVRVERGAAEGTPEVE